MRRPLCTLVLCLFAGCTHYRYEVTPLTAGPAPDPMTAPTAGPMTVMTDRDLLIPAAPARLRVRQSESRCVVLIENPTDTELLLDGQNSALVDPMGQTRAIAPQLIPAGAFTKLVLPPLRDTPPNGPAFQFGFGVVATTDTPRPAAMLDVGRAQDYWEWDADKPVRLVLTFKQNGQTSRHEFQVSRTKS